MTKKLLLIAGLLVAACDSDSSGPDTFALSADSVAVSVGASTTVSASGAGGSQPTFVSRNPNVAGVDNSGVITGVGVGVTYVVANAGQLADSVRVRVSLSGTGNNPIVLPLLGTGVVSERHSAEVAVSGNVAYTATWGARTPAQNRGNAIKIWNVAGNIPLLVDSIILPGVGTVSDVQISDDGSLLVASLESGGSLNNGLAIFNRSNPTQPTLLRRFSNLNTASGVHTVKLGRINNRLYAFLSINSGRLSIVDITNPEQPDEVFTVVVGGFGGIHDVFIRDGVLFAALWNTGLRVYDVGGAGRGGTPNAPVALGTIVTGLCKTCSSPSVHNVWWFHNPNGEKKYAFVGEEGPGFVGDQVSRGAIHVVDVSNFAAMREVAVYEPDSTTTANERNAGAHNFVMDEESGILYAAYYNAGVRALDVRGDLESCTAAQRTPDGRCDLLLMGREVGVAVSSGPPKYVWGVARVGTALYASDMWNGLFKIDISALRRTN